MLIGAILGMIATVIYYQFARMCQEYRHATQQHIVDLEQSAPVRSLEDPNKYLFRTVGKNFKEDDD